MGVVDVIDWTPRRAPSARVRPRRTRMYERPSGRQGGRGRASARAITGRDHSTDCFSTLLEQASYAQPAHDPGGDRTRGLRIKSQEVSEPFGGRWRKDKHFAT